MAPITLRDVYDAVNRVEDKLEKRITILEARQDVVESKVDMMMGKIGVVIVIVTLAVSAVITFAVDWFKKIFFK